MGDIYQPVLKTHYQKHLPHTQHGSVGPFFLCFLTCLRSRLWCNSLKLSTGSLAIELGYRVSPSKLHRDAPRSVSWLWRTPGCAGERLGHMAVFSLSSPRLYPFVLFFPPFEMWLILEAAELVQTVLLRIHPWEFSCKAQEKSDPWEEAKRGF